MLKSKAAALHALKAKEAADTMERVEAKLDRLLALLQPGDAEPTPTSPKPPKGDRR
jgi:hypothetical protein